MNKAKRIAIFKRLKEATPNPETELQYQNTFELLIAVILSAQATDVSVNLATEKLFAAASDPRAMRDLGIRRLKPFIKSIGLFNTKAGNILKTCQILIDKHNGLVPRDRPSLEALPGVGRKTANVILNTAFGVPTIAVDTHIFRISNRINLAPGKNVREVEDRLMRVVPNDYKRDAHHWLILHGRYVCVARKPRCGACVIEDLCEFKSKTEYD